MARVTVTVSGPTGSGKSRIALEIEVALKAAGIRVEWSDIDGQRQMEAEAHSEATGGWQPEMPEVVLQEINTPISIAEGFRRINPEPRRLRMPRVTMFEPIFAGLHRRGLVSLSPTAIDKLLSVSVEDHSSDMHPPQRLWSFLDRSQVSELHAVLGEWLAEHT